MIDMGIEGRDFYRWACSCGAVGPWYERLTDSAIRGGWAVHVRNCQGNKKAS